jgi:hypothetical protein
MELLMDVYGWCGNFFIPYSVRARFPTVDFSIKVAFAHPITGKPVFFVPDTPHLVKKLRNSLNASGRGVTPDKRGENVFQKGPAGASRVRDLKRRRRDTTAATAAVAAGRQPLFHEQWDVLSLRMLERAFRFSRIPGNHHVLVNKLGSSHFSLTKSTKMRVYLAVQVLSDTMAMLIRGAMDGQMPAGDLDFRNEPAHDGCVAHSYELCHKPATHTRDILLHEAFAEYLHSFVKTLCTDKRASCVWT